MRLGVGLPREGRLRLNNSVGVFRCKSMAKSCSAFVNCAEVETDIAASRSVVVTVISKSLSERLAHRIVINTGHSIGVVTAGAEGRTERTRIDAAEIIVRYAFTAQAR